METEAKERVTIPKTITLLKDAADVLVSNTLLISDLLEELVPKNEK